MTGRILAFPSPVSAAPRRESSYSFARVVVLLCLTECEARTQVDHLRRLARTEAMPLPKNPRFYGGKRQLGPASIGQKSVWDAAEFDEWRMARGSNAVPARTPTIGHAPGAAASMRAAMQQRARKLANR